MTDTLELELSPATLAALEEEADRLDMSTGEYAALLLRERSVVAAEESEDSPRSLRLQTIEERLAALEARLEGESLPPPEELATVVEETAEAEIAGDDGDVETAGEADGESSPDEPDAEDGDGDAAEGNINIDRLLDLYRGEDEDAEPAEDEDERWVSAREREGETETVDLGTPDGADDDDVASAIGQIDDEIDDEDNED
jgi:hypothetical protein